MNVWQAFDEFIWAQLYGQETDELHQRSLALNMHKQANQKSTHLDHSVVASEQQVCKLMLRL